MYSEDVHLVGFSRGFLVWGGTPARFVSQLSNSYGNERSCWKRGRQCKAAGRVGAMSAGRLDARLARIISFHFICRTNPGVSVNWYRTFIFVPRRRTSQISLFTETSNNINILWDNETSWIKDRKLRFHVLVRLRSYTESGGGWGGGAARTRL